MKSKREEIISELHKIEFRAVPTVVTLDLGLQYDYMSSVGVGTGLLAMADWPAYKFQNFTQKKWDEIRQSLKDQTFNCSILRGTKLMSLFERIENSFDKGQFDNKKANAAFSGLLKLSDEVPSIIYCLCDPNYEWSDYRYPVFYENETDLFSDFNDTYCLNYIKWEDMDDEDLIFWFDRLDDDLDGFPYYVGKEE